MPEPSGLTYPNRIARAFFLAMQDVMGRNGLTSLLTMANLPAYLEELPPDNLEREFDFAELAALSIGLEEMYGARGGRGMALRIGRAAFSIGIKDFGIMRGIGDPAFRVLPLNKRIDYGLQALATLLTSFSDQKSHVVREDNTYLFVSEVCPFSWGRVSDRPVSHAMVGIIQECLRWASNGYEFSVLQTACHSMGAPNSVFRVNKTAIGERGIAT